MALSDNLQAALASLAHSGESFVETDLVNAASENGWSNANYKAALKRSRALLSSAYTRGQLRRYGPVSWKGREDYVRLAGQILYAGRHGPAKVQTPNGAFSVLHKDGDPLLKPGRPAIELLSRDDFVPWSDQDQKTVRASEKPILVDGRPLEKRIQDLASQLAKAQARIQELESGGEPLPSEIRDIEDIMNLFGEFDERLRMLETRDEHIRQALTNTNHA